MATQTRAQGAATKKKSKATKVPSPTQPTGLTLWAIRTRAFIQGAVPQLEMSDRFKRELLGGFFAVIALLSGWAIGRGSADGAIVEWWGNLLRALFGGGAFIVPVFAVLVTVRTFTAGDGPVLLFRHYFGGVAFILGVTGLLDARKGGGAIGSIVADLMTGMLGRFFSGIVLFGLGTLSVFLLSGHDLHTFDQEIRRLLPKRVVEPVAAPAVPTPASSQTLTFSAVTATPRKAKKVVAEPVVETPIAPIVNLPEKPKEGKVTAVPQTDASKLKPVQAGLPFPLPDLHALPYYEQIPPDPQMLKNKATVIESTLLSFNVKASVREINPGPAVTQFALEPGNGVKVSRITALQSDLALALAAQSIRVEAPIPGLARVGIEIPNPQIATVGLREVLESPAFKKSKAKLPLPLGRDVNGRYIVGDLTKMPHLLIAGATGSGKSVCINGIISTMISVMQPDELNLVMIDPKMVELVGYNGVPHLKCPVVTEMDKVVGALRMVLREMNRRYELFKSVGVRNLDGYRTWAADETDAEKLPYMVVIIDELADLMMTTPDEVETLLARLTQMARATGIHLIIATQRPSVNVLTGLIKANVPARIAFAVSSMTDSRVVLDLPGAERLLGRGDMLYLPPDESKPSRIQGAFIDEEVKSIVDHWKTVSPDPHYDQEWLNLPSSGKGADTGGGGDYEPDEDEPLYQQAIDVVRAQGTASASMLQRRLRVGYNRAARMIEQMEEDGIIGPADGAKGRPVLHSFETPNLD
ncbi:MAG: DNA translocase FtsK [Thermomicrobiales bacterium]|nr:DNA translocase FtsK [Thermomicrobiales bacterium]MCO5218734.1 DNA translocase FtsK [Thermomicrobiales bacterium]MCO5225761.1 DNA translocase FtsK [Thermomicrobiales bacterium]MCO5228002.1 DNA translocase FtsK [Thermomicrobiales bacterium]